MMKMTGLVVSVISCVMMMTISMRMCEAKQCQDSSDCPPQSPHCSDWGWCQVMSSSSILHLQDVQETQFKFINVISYSNTLVAGRHTNISDHYGSDTIVLSITSIYLKVRTIKIAQKLNWTIRGEGE